MAQHKKLSLLSVLRSLPMSKTVITVQGDTVDGLLYKHASSNVTEDDFYQLNPSLIGANVILEGSLQVKIPVSNVAESVVTRRSVWD